MRNEERKRRNFAHLKIPLMSSKILKNPLAAGRSDR